MKGFVTFVPKSCNYGAFERRDGNGRGEARGSFKAIEILYTKERQPGNGWCDRLLGGIAEGTGLLWVTEEGREGP